MSSTSKRHETFLTGPMGEKPVMALPGISTVSAAKLEEKGFKKANHILGQFLVLDKDERRFKEWLHDACGANVKQQEDCYRCLQEWCNSFL
ncbi:barrier-to-autointegration factor-like [Anguilla rostrata]|uniref:barrier-to-autointegration factor-like n=1 Tax=Anguilla rostrata TaxID=7938 RepID=UPI0030CF4E60